MPMLRRTVAVLAAVLLTPGVAACGSGGSKQTGLAAAMDSVSGSGPAQQYFEYGNVARMRQLGLIDAAAVSGTGGKLLPYPEWSRVVPLGAGDFGPSAIPIDDATGLNIYAVDSAVSIGQPPNHATRFTGTIDAPVITSKLESAGARARRFDGTAGLSFGKDNVINLQNKLVRETNLVNAIDQVVVSKTQFAASPNAVTLAKVRGGGTSLLHTGNYGDLANCLGDVLGAAILRVDRGNTAVAAVGIRNPMSVGAVQHEVLCILPAAGKQHVVHVAVSQRLALTATDPVQQVKISRWASAVEVHDAGSLVQVVVTLRKSALRGMLLAGLYQNQIGYWDGSCPATAIAARRC